MLYKTNYNYLEIMSVFIDVSSDFANRNELLNIFQRERVRTYLYPQNNVEQLENELLAVVVGLKPSMTCSPVEGCTLDRSVELGQCKFAGLFGFIVIEGNTTETLITTIERKCDEHGFFAVPITKLENAMMFLVEIIRRIGAFYESQIKDTDLSGRTDIRRSYRSVVLREWQELSVTDKDSEAAKEALS